MLQLPQSNARRPRGAVLLTSKAAKADPVFAAIKRYVAAERAACRLSDDLDERESKAGAGLTALVSSAERAQAERERLAKALSETCPTTIAGATALLRFVLEDELCADLKWHVASIETVAAALADMKELT